MEGRRDLFFMLSIMAFVMTIIVNGMVVYLRTRDLDSNIFSTLANNTVIVTQVCVISTVGLLASLGCAILSWRNGVGLRMEQQHKETIEALKGKSND